METKPRNYEILHAMTSAQNELVWDTVEVRGRAPGEIHQRLRALVSSELEGNMFKDAMEQAGFPPNLLRTRQGSDGSWRISVTAKNPTKAGEQGTTAEQEVNGYKQAILGLRLPGIAMKIGSKAQNTRLDAIQSAVAQHVRRLMTGP